MVLLTGPERYQKGRILRQLQARCIDEGTEAFNLTRVLGSDIRWSEVVANSRTMPMMADHRLVIVSSVGESKDKDHDVLLEYLKDPSPFTCLVVDTEGADLRRQPFVALSKAATVVNCDALSPRDAEAFAQDYAQERGIKLQRRAANLLVERVGADQSAISGEIDRLTLLVHPDKTIEETHVAQAVGRSRALSVFEYVRALSRRDLPGAVALLRELVSDGEAPLGLLALIERQFRMMLSVTEEMDRGASGRDACRTAGVPPFLTSRFLDDLRAWDPRVIRAAYPLFLQKDQDMKSRGVSPVTELEMLTAELITL